MPRTKSLQHYPERYLEIVRECAIEGKTTRVELPTVKRGLSMRGHWYAFVGSLKAEATRIRKEALGLPTPGEQDILERAAQAPAVMVQLEARQDGSCHLIFQSREHSWQAQALRAGHTTQSDSRPTGTKIDEIAARLMQVQKETEDGNN